LKSSPSAGGRTRVRYACIQTRKKSFLAQRIRGVMGSKLLKESRFGNSEPGWHDPRSGPSEQGNQQTTAELDSMKPEWLQIKRLVPPWQPSSSRLKEICRSKITNWPISQRRQEFPRSNYAKELNAKPGLQYCVIQCHNLCEVKSGPYAYKGKGRNMSPLPCWAITPWSMTLKPWLMRGTGKQIIHGLHLPGRSHCLGYGVLRKRRDYQEGRVRLDLSWGNAEALVELTKKIANEPKVRLPVGEGCKIASEVLGKGPKRGRANEGPGDCGP